METYEKWFPFPGCPLYYYITMTIVVDSSQTTVRMRRGERYGSSKGYSSVKQLTCLNIQRLTHRTDRLHRFKTVGHHIAV